MLWPTYILLLLFFQTCTTIAFPSQTDERNLAYNEPQQQLEDILGLLAHLLRKDQPLDAAATGLRPQKRNNELIRVIYDLPNSDWQKMLKSG